MSLGTRFEAVRSDATGDITTVDTTSLVPRLGAACDLRGDGSTTLLGSYGHYSGRYNQVQFSANTSVSNPSEVDYVYSGPAGEGSDFAPGFDIANYRQAVFANFPTANVAMRDGIQSPIVRELTLGVDRTLGQRGHDVDIRVAIDFQLHRRLHRLVNGRDQHSSSARLPTAFTATRTSHGAIIRV